MRAYGSKSKKITAVAIVAVLIFAMVLSIAAYATFRANTNGGGIAGGVDVPVTTADITGNELKSNGATISGSNVRLNKHTSRNNNSIDVTDTAGGTDFHTSRFPTNYVEIPSYGVEYNLGKLFATSTSGSVGSRAVGVETFYHEDANNIVFKPGQYYTGDWTNSNGYGNNEYAIGASFDCASVVGNLKIVPFRRIIYYTTLALPDGVSVENNGVTMNFSAKAIGNANNGRSVRFAYSVIAETDVNGINSVLTGRTGSTTNSQGFFKDANTKVDAVKLINALDDDLSYAAGQTRIAAQCLEASSSVNHTFSANGVSVPNGTRFIRVMFAVEAWDAGSSSWTAGSKNYSAYSSLQDIKVTFNDSSTSVKSSEITVDSDSDNWTNEKTVSVKFNAYNGGFSLAESDLKRKITFDLFDYNANNGEGAWVNNVTVDNLSSARGADGRLLAEYMGRAGTSIRATDLDGNITTKNSDKVGAGVKLKLRTSRLKVRFNNGGNWVEASIDRSSEGTGSTGIIKYLDSKRPINNNINIMVTNLLERGLPIKISEIASGGTLATSAANGLNVSQDKLYYYFLSAAETFDSINLSNVNGTEIKNASGQSLTTSMLSNLPNVFSGDMNDRPHGQYRVVFYVKDIAGNAAPITVRTKYPNETNTNGAVNIIVDESGDITNGSLEAKIERLDYLYNPISGKTETDWTRGFIKLTLTYRKNETTSYAQNSGVIFKITAKDRADAGNIIDITNPYASSMKDGVYTDTYGFGTEVIDNKLVIISQFCDIKVSAMKGANENIELEGRFVDDSGVAIDKSEYTVRLENAELEYSIKSIDENGVESGYLNDTDFINGNKNIAIVVTGGNGGRYVSLYEEGRKMYIQYALLNDRKDYNATSSDLAGATWIDANYNTNNSNGQLNMYLGIGGSDSYNGTNWIRLVDKDGNNITSHTGKIVFRVALFDGEWLYFDQTTEENPENYSDNTLIVSRLDNVAPEATVTIQHMTRNEEWIDVTSGKWFSRDAKLVVTLNNYNDLMSLNMSDSAANMAFEDIFGDPNLDIYCDGGSDSEHLKIEGDKIIYTLHIGKSVDVHNFVRRFGLKLVTPAGNEGAVTTANGVEEPEGGFWLYYDNILPALVITAGNDEPITIDEYTNMESLGKWFNYNTEFKAGDNGQEHSPSGLKYTVKVFEGEVSYDDCIGGTIEPILTDEFTSAGNYTYPSLIQHKQTYTFLVDVVSGSDRFRSIAYTVKVDTVADGITLGQWTSSKDNIKYITDDAHTFNAEVTLDNTDKYSENKYVYIVTDKVMSDTDIETLFNEVTFDTLVGDMVITDSVSSGGNVSIQNFGDYMASNASVGFGKCYVYIFSYDEAGNIGIATALVEGEETDTLEAVIDSRDYSVVLNKSSENGTFTANSEGITVSEVTKTVKAGSVFAFEATAANGAIFLGYKTDVDGDDEANANASKTFIVAYDENASYKFIAVFKKVVIISDIDNNMQIDLSGGALSIKVPTGTAKVGADNNVSIDLSSTEYLKVEYYADGDWRGSDIDSYIGSEGGNYSYRISISDLGKYEYYMSDYFMSSVVISNRLSLRIDFDINNTARSYVYNNVDFVNVSDIVNSLFFNKVTKDENGDYAINNGGNYLLSVERPVINSESNTLERTEDFTAKFIEGIINAADVSAYLTLTDRRSGETVTNIKNAGEYTFAFSYRYSSGVPNNSENIGDYDISFTYDFVVEKREFTVTPIGGSVDREYDGTDIVEASTNHMDWSQYVTLGNLADGESLSVLNLMADSFTFDSEGVLLDANNGARIRGFRFSNENYQYNGSNEIFFEDANITPYRLLLQYTGLEYVKTYDGTDKVCDEDIDDFKKLMAGRGDISDYYFMVRAVVMGEDVSFEFGEDVLVLDSKNAGDRTITISKDAFNIYVDGAPSANYIVGGFEDVEGDNIIINANIEKKEITISYKKGVRTFKEFDAKGFNYPLNYTGLAESDVTMDKGEIVSVDSYGIPTVFNGVYTVERDGKDPLGVWDQGSYVLTFDNSLIDNYVIVGNNEFVYLITPKELYVKIAEKVGADNVSDASAFVNFKYYDGLAVQYQETFTANGAAGANAITYIVSDGRGELYDMISGYSIDITFDMPNAVNAMVHEIGRLTSRVTFNGEATGNYNVTYTRDGNSFYEIRKRPLVVKPNITALEYTGETQVLTFSKYTGESDNFTITDGISIDDSWSFDASVNEFRNAAFNMSFTLVNEGGESGIGVGNYVWKFLSDAYKDQMSLQNYSFSVSSDAEAEIIAAKLYLKFNASHFAGTHYYDDRSISLDNKLPSIIVSEMNGNFDIIDSTGSVTTLKDLSVGNITLEYKVNNTKTGGIWTTLDESNYSAGQIAVYTVISNNTNSENYQIVNLVDGEAVKIPAIGGGTVAIDDSNIYEFTISPVTISVTSNILEQNYRTDNIAAIAKKAFSYSINEGAYLESEGLHSQLDLTSSTTVKIKDTDTNSIVNIVDPEAYLDAGVYQIDFSILQGYFSSAPNYRLVFTSEHNNRITINKVAIYARITSKIVKEAGGDASAVKNGVYDSNIHVMEAKVFVDEYGRVIADESGSEVAYFVAQSALGENAVNQGQYRLVYVDEITLLDTTYTSNISSMKNYIFNTNENNIEGSNSFTITKRAVNIRMVRKDGQQENSEVFGQVISNNGVNYTFDLINSFDFEVTNYADNVDAFKERFASNLKYDFTARNSSVTAERTVYDIKFNGYAAAIQDSNYVFNISEWSGFVLSKKIIESEIVYDNSTIAPTSPTYGKDANSFNPSKIDIRYRFRSDRTVINNISDYLEKTPEIVVTKGQYDAITDTVPYVYTIDASGIVFRDGIGNERPLYETYTLRNMTDEGDTRFEVNIKRASLELSIAVGVEEPVGGYVYGKNEFDPNNVDSYRVNTPGIVEGDKFTCDIIPEFVRDNGDGTVTFKATIANYSVENEVFYNIKIKADSIEYVVKKADITVGIMSGGASGNIVEYNANFLDYFTASIAGLPSFDAALASGISTKFKITKAVKKSDKEGYSDITVNVESYTVADKFSENFDRYYVISIAEGDGVTVEAKRALLSINAGIGSKEYAVDYSEETYPFANMNVTGFVFDTDKAYVFTDLVDETTTRFLKLDPARVNAYNALTVQNEPISINGSSQYFVVDDTLIAQSDEMYLYDVNMIFVFKVTPCVINAKINKKNAEGENGYSFVFGDNAKKIYDSIEIVILRESDATATPIENNGIISVEGESEIGDSEHYYPVVGTHFIRTNFKLLDKVNYTLVHGDMDTVSVKVAPKELKYFFNNDYPITEEFGEYSFLEEAELFASKAKYSIDARQFVPGYESIDVSVVRANAADMSVAVGKYALALKTLDRNYTLSLAGEPCYYEVKAKNVEFNFADIEKDYGFTLSELKNIYDYSTGKREAILQSFVKGWTNIKESVRKEIMNSFTFAVSGDTQDVFAITSETNEPYTVSVSFGENQNIAANYNTFSLTVNAIALERAITNSDRTEIFKGLNDPIALGIVSNNAFLNVESDVNVVIAKDGVEVDSIIEVGEYTVKVTSTNVNFVGEKVFTVVVDKKDYVTSSVYGGGIKTVYYNGDIDSVKYPAGYDDIVEKYAFDIAFGGEVLDGIDKVVSTMLGEYAITLSVLPNEDNAENNYNASVSSIRIRVVKEVIDFAIDLTSLNQTYGETYPIVAGNGKLVPSDYTVTYKDASGNDIGEEFALGKLAVGKYTVVIEKSDSCMYDVASVTQTLIINSKVIDTPGVITTDKNNELFGEIVSGEGVTFDRDNNYYKTYYNINGVSLDLIGNDVLFGEFAEDVDGVAFSVNGKKTESLVFGDSGVYNIAVSYFDNDNNVIVKDANFTLNVYKLIINDSANIGKLVFASDIDTFNGEAPVITATYVDGDKSYELSYKASFAIDNGTRYVETQVISGAGKYLMTVNEVDEKNYVIASGDGYGVVEWEYEIKKLNIEFSFGEDIVTEYVYGDELKLPIDTNNNDWAVIIRYYDAKDTDFADPFEEAPTAVGKYVIGIINAYGDDVKLVGKDSGEVALAEGGNVIFSMPFEIKQATYAFETVPTIDSKVSLNKTYDGSNLKLTPDMSLFSGFGLPEGTSVVLEAYRGNGTNPVRSTSDCGTYKIKARFENDNYDFGDLRVDYGTYEVTPTEIKYTVDKKTADTIIINVSNEIIGFTYQYSIDGGKTWTSKNKFTDLDADTEYEIMIRVDDESGNFAENKVGFKLTTAKQTKVTDSQIILIAIAGGAALLFIAFFVTVMIIRKKRNAY